MKICVKIQNASDGVPKPYTREQDTVQSSLGLSDTDFVSGSPFSRTIVILGIFMFSYFFFVACLVFIFSYFYILYFQTCKYYIINYIFFYFEGSDTETRGSSIDLIRDFHFGKGVFERVKNQSRSIVIKERKEWKIIVVYDTCVTGDKAYQNKLNFSVGNTSGHYNQVQIKHIPITFVNV